MTSETKQKQRAILARCLTIDHSSNSNTNKKKDLISNSRSSKTASIDCLRLVCKKCEYNEEFTQLSIINH